MSTRTVSFVPGEFYHVYNRGTDKRIIFKSNSDYKRFLNLLYLCNSEKSLSIRSIERSEKELFDFDRGTQLISVGAYCLMPNHFHMLVTPNIEGGLSTFMNKLGTSYSMYFNKKYERSGSLFEGAFKAEYIDTDEYLKYLFSYIHLNPVKLIQSDWKDVGIRDKRRALAHLEKYLYSSFSDFDSERESGIAERKEARILGQAIFPEYFKTRDEFRKEIIEWLSFKELLNNKNK